jgi:hypothetical protein
MVLADSKQSRKSIEKLVEMVCSAPVKWLRESAKDVKALGKLLKPHKIGLLDRLYLALPRTTPYSLKRRLSSRSLCQTPHCTR